MLAEQSHSHSHGVVMPSFGPVIPILRSFDDVKAREFYVDFLGFKVDFEHRFGPNFPLYMGLSQAGCVLHLSEHHGDACPGAQVRIRIDDIVNYIHTLTAKNYKYAKPGPPGQTPWQTLEVTITDPFGNRLTFVQETSPGAVAPQGSRP
jgi:catechol 2,3-dioxygenase-like lactoylglutathione lyase family enzyme